MGKLAWYLSTARQSESVCSDGVIFNPVFNTMTHLGKPRRTPVERDDRRLSTVAVQCLPHVAGQATTGAGNGVRCAWHL